MITWIYNKMHNLPPVFIDGFLYFLIAVFGSIEAGMANDDAYKYMNAYVVFYIKFFSAIMLAGATAIKMFRSTTYSEHKKATEDAASTVSVKSTETTTKTSDNTTTPIKDEKVNV